MNLQTDVIDSSESGGIVIPPCTLEPAPRRGWLRVAQSADGAISVLRQFLPGTTDVVFKVRGREVTETWLPSNARAILPSTFTVPPLQPKPFAHREGSKLRAYQETCVKFALSTGSGAVYLGLDMGLGKTVTATTIAVVEEHKRVLVVGPLIAKGAWCGEHSDPMRWYGIDVRPLKGRKDTVELAKETMLKDGWVFVHYDILDAWKPWVLSWFRPSCVIFDELDYARSDRSRLSKAARAIGKLSTVKRAIGLSGTAVHNKVMDLWPQLDALEPDGWGKRHEFGIRYCNGHHGEFGYIYDLPTHVDELKARLNQVYIRFERKAVLAELPSITRQRVETELDQETMEEYHQACIDIRDYLEALGRGLAPGDPGILAKITILMRLLATAKAPATAELARHALENGDKVVVFSWFKDSAKKIARALSEWTPGPVTGEMPTDERLALAAEFGGIEGPAAFVATIASAGVALNGLQAASLVIISDLWWTTAKLLQAEGRVWRSGQAQPVVAYYGLAKDTIDEKLLSALLIKAEAISQSTGDVDPEDLTSTLNQDGLTSAQETQMFVDILQRIIEEAERDPWAQGRPQGKEAS